jgi:hypothetical protein
MGVKSSKIKCLNLRIEPKNRKKPNNIKEPQLKK